VAATAATATRLALTDGPAAGTAAAAD